MKEPKPILLHLLRDETKTYSPISSAPWKQNLILFLCFSYAMEPKPTPLICPALGNQNLFPYICYAMMPKHIATLRF